MDEAWLLYPALIEVLFEYFSYMDYNYHSLTQNQTEQESNNIQFINTFENL